MRVSCDSDVHCVKQIDKQGIFLCVCLREKERKQLKRARN